MTEDKELEKDPRFHANLCDQCADHQKFSGELIEFKCLNCRKMAKVPKEILDKTDWTAETFCRDCMAADGICHACMMMFVKPSEEKVKKWLAHHEQMRKEEEEWLKRPIANAYLCDQCSDYYFKKFSGELIEFRCLSCAKMSKIPKEILDKAIPGSLETFCRECMRDRGTCHICAMMFVKPSEKKVKEWAAHHEEMRKDEEESMKDPRWHVNLCDQCFDYQKFSGELVEFKCLDCGEMSKVPKELLDRNPWFSDTVCQKCMSALGICHGCGMIYEAPSKEKVKEWVAFYERRNASTSASPS